MASKPVKYERGIWVLSVNGEFPEDEYENGHIGVKSKLEVILMPRWKDVAYIIAKMQHKPRLMHCSDTVSKGDTTVIIDFNQSIHTRTFISNFGTTLRRIETG